MKAIVTLFALIAMSTAVFADTCNVCNGTGKRKVNAEKYDRCEKCNGTGQINKPSVCSTCLGKGNIKVNITDTKTCPKCGGTGKG
jgi:DnaJ-class molecular chaperone